MKLSTCPGASVRNNSIRISPPFSSVTTASGAFACAAGAGCAGFGACARAGVVPARIAAASASRRLVIGEVSGTRAQSTLYLTIYSTIHAVHASHDPRRQPEPGQHDQSDDEHHEPDVGRPEHPEPPLALQGRTRRDRRVAPTGEQANDDAPQATLLLRLEPHELEAHPVRAHRPDDGLLHLDGRLASDQVELDAHGGALDEPRRSLHREALERELRRLARRARVAGPEHDRRADGDRKSTRLNSSHDQISYAVFCLKKKTKPNVTMERWRPASDRSATPPSATRWKTKLPNPRSRSVAESPAT